MIGSTLAVLLAFAGGSWIAWRSFARPLAVGLGGFALLPATTLVREITWPIAAAAAVVAGAVAWQRWARTSATVIRWGARARRKSGVASSVDVFRKGSAWRMRTRASTLRPSLAETGLWKRVRTPARELGIRLCRVGVQPVWSSIENVALVFGGPRMGKSGWLASRILDAPGAVVATSTRTDLVTLTAGVRQQRGPVFVFNPVGLGDLDSTITFDPLTGCTNPMTAMERATDMVAATVHHGSGGGDRAFWESQARRVLAALLHAGALGQLSMRDVLDWVSQPDQARDQLISVLRRSPEPGFVEEISQFLATNDRTRTSITSTIMPALSWLTSPAAVRAAIGAHPFDVAELLTSRATVYLLGAEETHTAPLVCALTGHIAREARRIAAHQPSGRLDPPLTLALDEAALISPVPLDRWSADMGGRGVCIVAAFQSRAQLIDRFGDARAATTINNAGAKILFGGTGDRDDLQYWSTLAGERDEPVTSTDMYGRTSRSVRRVPVLAPAQLAQLPPHKVVAFTSGLPPVVGRADKAWRRADVRAQLTPEAFSVRARAAVRRAPAAIGGRVAAGWQAAGVFIAKITGGFGRAWTRGIERYRPRWATRPDAAVTEEPTGAEVVPFPVPAAHTERVRPTPYPRSSTLRTVEWSEAGRDGLDEPGSWN